MQGQEKKVSLIYENKMFKNSKYEDSISGKKIVNCVQNQDIYLVFL